MSIEKLTSFTVGERLNNVYCKDSKSSVQYINFAGLFVSTPATPITAGQQQAFLYKSFNGNSAPICQFYWEHIGGVLGVMQVAIKSADNLTTYAIVNLDLAAPATITLVNSIAFPLVDTKLKIVLITDATCNATILPVCMKITQ